MGKRSVLIGAAGAVVGSVVGATAVVAVLDDDGRSPVAARELPQVLVVDPAPVTTVPVGDTAADVTPATTAASAGETVRDEVAPVTRVVLPALTEVTGVVSLLGDELMMDGRELDIGPDRWAQSTMAPSDVDGDGTIESWWDETRGLVGTEVTVLALGDDEDLDVFDIAGVTLRPPYSEVPPWSGGWDDGDYRDDEYSAEVAELLENGLTAEQAATIALGAVPGVVIDIEIDINDGRPYWELDIRATDGAVYDVEIDAVTGAVIEIDRS